MPPTLTVVIVAESLLLGDGLASLLASEPDITILGRARTVDEIRPLVDQHQPDILLVSVLTPLVSTLQTIVTARELRASRLCVSAPYTFRTAARSTTGSRRATAAI